MNPTPSASNGGGSGALHFDGADGGGSVTDTFAPAYATGLAVDASSPPHFASLGGVSKSRLSPPFNVMSVGGGGLRSRTSSMSSAAPPPNFLGASATAHSPERAPYRLTVSELNATVGEMPGSTL